MPAPTLTPAQAITDYTLTVEQVDLDDAAEVIHAVTTFTLAEHVDTRLISTGNVRRAWALVASRLRANTTGDAARDVISESDPEYSYNVSGASKAASQLSLLAGLPNELLDIGAEWVDYRGSDGKVPPTLDDHGVPFT